jgi:hypothetical protein
MLTAATPAAHPTPHSVYSTNPTSPTRHPLRSNGKAYSFPVSPSCSLDLPHQQVRHRHHAQVHLLTPPPLSPVSFLI